MGHTHHTYDEFDSNLTRPLYGHITDLKGGAVPQWVKGKTLTQEIRVAKLLGIEYTDYESELSRSRLPKGVDKDHSHLHGSNRTRTEYVFTPEKWLAVHRKQASEDTINNSVTFELDTGSSAAVQTTSNVPDEIEDRLDAVSETSQWDRKFDGHHVNFRQWLLCYKIGNRGGIQSVKLKAVANR